MRIYFAGPLFTPYERGYISRCAQVLRENGFHPFVPHESPKINDPADTRSVPKRVFDQDFGAIREANAVLAIINGTEVDDGTACELGIFYALMQTDPSKKGIVALHEDWRTLATPGEGKDLNAFVAGCIVDAGCVCHSLEDAIVRLRTWRDELDAAKHVHSWEARP